MPAFLAIDLGATNMRAAVVEGPKVLARVSTPTRAWEGPSAVVRRMVDLTRDLALSHPVPVAALGIAAPGPLDPVRGLIFKAPNMPDFKEEPVAEVLSEALGLRTFLINDADAAALAEHRYGAGRRRRHMLYLTISTGIGGGIVVHGQLVRPDIGMAGEVGHIVVDVNGDRCGCGRQGCLEAMASGRAIAQRARSLIDNGVPTLLAQMEAEQGTHVSAETVVAAAQQGDAIAIGILNRAAFYLGVGLVSLLHVLNPDVVVLGGGVMAAGDLILEPARAEIHRRALHERYAHIPIERAKLGDDAGLIGAGLWAGRCLSKGAKKLAAE
jgi:glucokinase